MYVNQSVAGQLHHMIAEFQAVFRGLFKPFRNLLIDHVMPVVLLIIIAYRDCLDLICIFFPLIKLQPLQRQ